MNDFIRQALANQGFAVLAVSDAAGPWAYSVGFTDLGHPEILISGLRPDLCHGLFWTLYSNIKQGKVYHAGEIDTDLANLPTAFRRLQAASAEEYCCQAIYWYEARGQFPQFLQMVMPDREGRFPWQTGFDVLGMQGQRALWQTFH